MFQSSTGITEKWRIEEFGERVGGKDMEGLESGVFRWVGGLSPLGPLCVVS